jgi:hypothetical protein
MNAREYFSPNKQQGIASYVALGIVAILLLSSIFIGVVVISNQTIGTTEGEKIATVLAVVAGKNGATYSDVRVIQKNTTHARGQLIDSRDAKQKDFFARKVSNTWQIVSIIDDEPSCELYGALGFESAFISNCEKTYPDAVTVETAKETLQKAIKPTFLQVIARVTAVETITKFVTNIITGNNNPEGDGGTYVLNEGAGTDSAETETVTVITVTSGDGETITTEVSDESEGDDVSVGDTIILGVIIEPNQNNNQSNEDSSDSSGSTNEGENNEGTVTVTDVVNVTEDANEITPVEEVTVGDNENPAEDTDTPNTSSQDSNQNGSGVYQLGEGIENYGELENVFDIDNSDVLIKIEG